MCRANASLLYSLFEMTNEEYAHYALISIAILVQYNKVTFPVMRYAPILLTVHQSVHGIVKIAMYQVHQTMIGALKILFHL